VPGDRGIAGHRTFAVVAYIVGDWGKEHHPEFYGGASGMRQYQSATAIYLPHGGEIRACTAGSASKDGGKETFVVADESHLYVLRELKSMYGTIRRNLGKRKLAQPWLHADDDRVPAGRALDRRGDADRLAQEGTVAVGPRRPPRGQGPDPHPGRRAHDEAAPVRLRGRVGVDGLDRIYREMLDPRSCPDDATAARYFLNRPMSTVDAWIAKDVAERQVRRGDVVAAGEAITLGFDGSLNDDTTVLRGCRMSDGFRFRIGAWPKPEGAAGIGWEVPRADVLATIREAFGRYDVVRAYFDPHEWRTDIDDLAAEFGERVVAWATTRDTAMGAALDRLHADLMNGETFHDDDPLALEHYGNVYVRHKGSLRLVRKEYPNSPRKIDSVVGDALAYEARADALAAGWGQKQSHLTRVAGRARSY
jgi:hypothetical protein